MAIAGLHNVSSFGPSFFGEARHDQSSTQASTVLQIWREIEGEHAVNQSYRSKQHGNGSGSECSSTSTSFGRVSDNRDDISQHSDESENHGFTGSEIDHEENGSIVSEQSSDLGEIERERVRQIFRDWMNSGSKGPPSYGFNLNNRSGQRLGENECQRVRIIRERVQTTAQQRNSCGSVRDGVGSQLEQGRDGLAIFHSEIGPQRRRIRRLCGRQTLLDLLLRAQTERESELVALSERRPVSYFAHRNRIQALLRGRFLRNESSVLHDRTSSNSATTELSLLRQRHTVSDRREEFLSKLENSASSSANIAKSDSLSSGENNEESPGSEREVAGINVVSELESVVDTNTSHQERQLQVNETEVPGLDNEGRDQDLHVGNYSHMEEPAIEASQQQVFIDVDNDSSGERINAVTDELLTETEAIHSSENNEVHNENELRSAQSSNAFETDVRTTALEGSAIEEIHLPNLLSQVEEFQESGIEIASTELVDAMEEETNQWPLEARENNVEVQDQMQASHEDWPNQDFEEAIDSWLDMPSRAADESFARIDTFYFPDDDNAHSMEIRELYSRRRVSSLLRSGFRESLNQVLQSHVERLGHTSDDWELENAPPEHHQEQLNQNQSLSDNSERNHFEPTMNFFTSELLWDEELPPTANWPRHLPNQQLVGTGWEVINELRLDMARLQQRMDNMQRMLETCMDMQIELQRALRQEVSAALNRSDANKSRDGQIDDESSWDHVRKGSCCLCRDSKIDSLLYRCGHMCCCSKCAENLVQQKGKCPMCEAPVVEVVRAYFVQ